jgi:hypothetical protein
MRYRHTIAMLDGSKNKNSASLICGLKTSVAIPAASGAATGAVVLSPGSFAAIPTLVAADGSGATFAASMGGLTSDVAAAGTGYAPGDTSTLTGGTGTKAVMAVDTTQLVSVAINAKGTGYVPNDTVRLAGGSFNTRAILTVSTTELASLALNAPGTAYVVNDTVTLAGGTHTTAAIATVSKIQLVTVAMNAAGTLYTPGDVITLVGGTHTTSATVMVDTVDGVTGAITSSHIIQGGVYTVGATTFTSSGGSGSGATWQTGVFGIQAFTISNAGVYSVNAATFTQTSTSGSGVGATFQTAVYAIHAVTITTAGSYTLNTSTFTQASTSGAGSGATFQTALFGVNTAHIYQPGLYSVLASNPISQGSSSGAGTGATFDILTYGVASIAESGGGSGYNNGSAITVSGDLTGFLGAVTTIAQGASIEMAISGLNNTGLSPLPSDYGVFVTPNGPCNVSVNSKTANGFNVVFTPFSATAYVTASAFDLAIFA